MRLGLDFETSGLFRKELPHDDPSQPSIVQIGAILFDRQWVAVGKLVTLIRPDRWSMEPDAEARHGISEDKCAQFGIPIIVAMIALKSLIENALQVFAHNAEFERSILLAQLAKLRTDDLWWRRKAASTCCTMQLSTAPCGLPNRGYPGFKFPTLEEAMRRFYPALARPSKHEAEADVMDAAMVAQALQHEGLWPDIFKPGWRAPE